MLELRGAFRKHPERRKAREGEPEIKDALGGPPKCLDEAQAARWKEIAEMYPWVNRSHRLIVEQTAVLWALQRSGQASTADMKLLQANIRVLGGTPSDSSRVKMPEPPASKDPAAAKRRRFFGGTA